MFSTSRVVIVLALAVIIATPWVVRLGRAGHGAAAAAGASTPLAGRLIIVTPHVEQIRDEFDRAFSRWHEREYRERVEIDWRTPGGTTEIIKILQSQYTAALTRVVDEARRKDPGVLLRGDFDPAALLAAEAERAAKEKRDSPIPVDLVFGGGSFDHGRLKDAENVKLFVGLGASAGEREVKLTVGKRAVDFGSLGTLRSLVATAEFDGQKMTLRVPAEAIAGGAAALAALKDSAGTERETLSASFRVDLSRCERQLGVPMSMPPRSKELSKEAVAAIYGENAVGAERLYDGDRFWLGTALSGFGIVYNRPLLTRAGMKHPRSFKDLTDPRYAGRLALADPRQSGSVATLYDSILNVEGWDEGWRILREMGASARYFSASSTQPPMDVGQGEAWAGVAIDFYGRGQAQAVLQADETPETGRLGYVDPEGAVYIDADPISLMRGGPSRELAERFMRFCLTNEAQALWQFPPTRTAAGKSNPPIVGRDGQVVRDAKGEPVPMGPEDHRLRRMPVLRGMYADAAMVERFADRTNPFEIASKTRVRGWRSGMIMLLGCMAIDAGEELRAARVAVLAAEGKPGFPAERLAEMKRKLAAMPDHVFTRSIVTDRPATVAKGTRWPKGAPMPDGSGNAADRTLEEKLEFPVDFRVAAGAVVPITPDTLRWVSAETDRWRHPEIGPKSRIAYTEFFRRQFREVVSLGAMN